MVAAIRTKLSGASERARGISPRVSPLPSPHRRPPQQGSRQNQSRPACATHRTWMDDSHTLSRAPSGWAGRGTWTASI